jgi:hypothetical protein
MAEQGSIETAADLLLAKGNAMGVSPAAVKKKFENQLALIPLEWPDEAAAEINGDNIPRDPHKIGRPHGARALATRQWVEVILATKRSPLEFLADIYSRPLELLCAEIGCDRVKGLELMVRCAEAALPYLHQKQSTAEEIAQAALATLVMPAVAASSTIVNGELNTVPILTKKIEPNQGDSVAESGQSENPSENQANS